MDIQKINEENEPAYPTLNNHRVDRRSALRTIVGGLAVAGLIGCKEKERPQAAGTVCCPAPPEKPPVDVKGDMPAPTPPGKPVEIKTRGEMIAPAPPQRHDHPQVDGGMPVPKKPDHLPNPGSMPAPKKPGHPDQQDRPALGGVMIAPEPPKK